MKQLGAQDAQFLHADTENSFANVATVLIFGPPKRERARLDLESLIEHVRSRLHMSPIFRRRLVRVPLELDYPYWVNDEHFDVDYHVEYSCLPEPGTWSQFRRFVSKYHNKPMDMNRPLWEVCLLDGLDAIEGIPRGSFALILKAHHAAVDGATGMQFFAGFSDIDEEGTPALAVELEPEETGAAPRTGEMLTRALINNARSPIRLMDTLWRVVPGLLPMVLRKLSGGDREDESFVVPDTRFNRALSPQKHFDACWFALSDFKRIKSRVEGATVNDVVLAVCGGALRKYLLAHKDLPHEPLVAWVPINARPKDGSSGEAIGNQISAMTVPLFTDLETAEDRLAAITRQTRRSKEAMSGAPAKLLTEMSQHFPAYSMALVTRMIIKGNIFKRLCNVMITNVPGPQVPLYLKGAPCLHQLGLTPIGDGMGLCIGTPSYNGELVFMVISTPLIIPDIDFFVQCLRDSFGELNPTSPSRKRRRRSRQNLHPQ
ncbi:MAG: wax ester/triacylglycerol synthase family O-acyltransferase [Steroidobacteraceae bacterium]